MITITTQGALFNSPLHFIGFGRGNIVNSEVVQRLGTYYPIAGGVSQDRRDLQMTSIDAPTGNGVGILDPEYTIWNNVTYADNYYQTLESPIAAHGKAIAQADWNVDLSSLAGFEQPGDKFWNPHLKTLAWYLGTTNVSLGTIDRYLGTNNNYSLENPFGSPAMNSELINRRLGDLYTNGVKVYEDVQTWYTPDHTRSTSVHGNNNSVWEGIGTGWFNSVSGGGSGLRPYGTLAAKVGVSGLAADYFTTHRIDVRVDNTNTTMGGVLRGDYAVPTLFDGNFDAITTKFDDQLIPGWGGYNNDFQLFSVSNAKQKYLKYGVAGNNSYSLKLGDGLNKVTHNISTVPDWGTLRFDLHTGDVERGISRGQLKVFLDEVGITNTTPIQIIELQEAEGESTAAAYEADRWRIGYGQTGFETFTIDVPEALRGKVATLRFELTGGEVFVDNVFFKSQHLMFGNPTESRSDNFSVSNFYFNNYLLEKPQYSSSFSGDSHIPNWSAWQINKSWLGSGRPSRDFFFRDESLTEVGFTSAKNTDYSNRANSDIIPGPTKPDGTALYKLAPGHLAANGDRNRFFLNDNGERIYKDSIATYSTSNIIPQHEKHNSPLWSGLEDFSRLLVNEQGKEVYAYAGGVGEKNSTIDKANISITNDSSSAPYSIQVPSHLWKVLLIVDNPRLSLQDITTQNTKAFAVWTENTLPLAGTDTIFARWNEGGMQVITVEQLENRLNNDSNNLARGIVYNFFSTLPDDIARVIKRTSVSIPVGKQPHTSFLLADEYLDTQELSITDINTPVGQNSVAQDFVFNPEILVNFSISQVGSGQINFVHSGSHQASINQDGTREVRSPQVNILQVGSTQIRCPEIGSSHTGLGEVCSTQISSTQINLVHEDFVEKRISQGDSTQISTGKFLTSSNIDSIKLSLPSSITLQQLLSSHNPNLQNTTVPTWTEFLQSPTPFNLKIEIQDLPTGQLAEATITGYDTNGRPNSGTLTLDTDGNSLGWFIDTTPEDNTEFDQTLSNTAYRATTGAAAGKYDLLTTILHELGHLNGIIRGNTAFDTHVQNINGIPTFINGGITAQLTPDGSHLDSTLYPYDLMNTSLKPGVRKLPSALDLAILNTIWSNKPTTSQQLSTTANLTAGALIGITNGDFTTPTTWNTAGATNIINGTATLTEQSQKLSELTQAFIISTGAKTLQFTIKDNHLVTGDTTKTANDAFEVALLDTNTYNPLAGTSIGLNHTDSLLNIQANGTIHKSDKVTITALGNNSSIVTIDLTQVTPSTQATLYFNLLGFGSDGQISHREHPTFLNGSKVLTVNLYIL